MNIIDVSESVMKKVADFERRRIAVWFCWFIVMMVGLFVGCGVIFVLVVRDLLEKRAFDFIELFTQDREIIAEFWREVLVTFWDELPIELITFAVCILGALLIFIIITKKRRAIMQKKLHQLDKYS